MRDTLAGQPAVFMDAIDSTNAEAQRRIRAGALAAPLWFVACRQEKGKGRHGRAWHSPEGNLYASLATPAPAAPLAAAQTSFAVAIALAETLERQGAPAIACKWPNDVLCCGRKLAGILLERVSDPQGQPWLIVGIGVNIASAPADDAVTWPAIALADLDVAASDAGALAESLAQRLAHWRARLAREGFAPLRAAWMQRAYGMGTRTRVKRGDGVIEGQFLGLDETGAARLRLDSGPETLVHAGEIMFARAKDA
ncbi:MAG: biotin--[acetyl-CoA-carboxylase] ligase [Alphaproteobacteria bacterium]|nr:MAG: biotin--[acetyl-CoA-carboxylase] ligase [Alphaproteobacteria bacterium]